MEKNTKSPAFQFYVQDFLSGVKFFSAEETGAYILLLCEQWDSGFIENNEKILKKITGISPKKLQKVLEKFQIFENKLINKRLDDEKKKKLAFIDRASEGGKESARLRAEKNPRSVEIKQVLKSKSSTSTSTSTSEERKKENNNSIVETSSTTSDIDASFFENEEEAFTESVNAKKTKKEKPAGATPAKKVPTVFTACIEVYNQFIISRTGVPGKFDGIEGKGMNSIIAYLATVSNEKTDEGIINSWKHILSFVFRCANISKLRTKT